MKYFSTFSGIGGFERSIEEAFGIWHRNNCQIGNETCSAHQPPICVGFSEFDPSCDKQVANKENPKKKNKCKGYHVAISQQKSKCCECGKVKTQHAVSIYQRHFPKHFNYGDITKIKPEELPDFDILIGGVPCQSWSVAGKRGGFEDDRGNMWFYFADILKAKKPKYFLAENVKGLLSHDKGNSMERICELLCECGYAIDFEILNSKNFGVPQSRERVFIIGKRIDLLDTGEII